MSDWTIDHTGRSNSSPRFQALVDLVARCIREGAYSLINGDVESVARTIMAQLAHVENLAPPPRPEATTAPTNTDSERAALEAVVRAARDVEEWEALPEFSTDKKTIESIKRLRECHERMSAALAELDRIRNRANEAK